MVRCAVSRPSGAVSRLQRFVVLWFVVMCGAVNTGASLTEARLTRPRVYIMIAGLTGHALYDVREVRLTVGLRRLVSTVETL